MTRASLRGLGLAAAAVLLASACSGSGNSDAADTPATDAAGEGIVEGAKCDDGQACTAYDRWVNGECVGEAYSCEYLGECWPGGCDGNGDCEDHGLSPGWCYIGACVKEGDLDPQNSCAGCFTAKSTTEYTPVPTGTPCEDGNLCTEGDTCDSGDCLAGSPPTCADGVLCTVDECDLETGCKHTPDHAQCKDDSACTRDECIAEKGGCVSTPDDTLVCADEDVCTTGDHCSQGKCVVDPQPLSCDDDNVCTDDSCHPSFGCLYVFNELPCDDGAACTQEDTCFYGNCKGTEDWWTPCPTCTKDFPGTAAKISALRVGVGGFPGEAVNVDGDLKTCSPPGSCELGLDNSLSFAGEYIDQVLAQNMALDAGLDALIFLVDLSSIAMDGTPFPMTLVYAEVSVLTNPDCDFTSQTCFYTPSSLSFDVLCNPLVVFSNATISDGVLKAGGSGSLFPFEMSFVNGKQTTLVLFNAKVEAKVELDGDGKVSKLSGVFGGAVTKQHLTDMIQAIPQEYIPVDLDLLLTMVDLMPEDIDLNGDGAKDAISLALVFETIPGILEQYVGN
jgi:hypothetical protein